jgi:hypothetical protein
MVGSIQGSSVSDASTINLQDFKDGKVNISKSELKNSVSATIAQGQEPSNALLDIIDSYEKIDTNGDGIGYKELETYKSTPAGIISSMGLSPEALKQKQLNLFVSAFLNNNSSNTSSDSYLNSLMQSYTSSNNDSNPSLFNYIT